MWWMGKFSVNREQYNTAEELSVQAEVALVAITIEPSRGWLRAIPRVSAPFWF
jgi:hypothetical protein